MITTFQGLVHWASLVVLGVVIVATIVALFKPRIPQKLFYDFGKRRYILATGTFLILLCGTIFLATQPSADNTYVSENNRSPAYMADMASSDAGNRLEAIKTEDITVTEPVAYPKERRHDPALPEHQSKIIQAGKNGEMTVVYTLTYDKGKEVSRAIKSKVVTVKPTAEITAVGTRVSAKPKPAEQARPAERKRERSFLPQFQLSCKKDSDSSRFRICLHKH